MSKIEIKGFPKVHKRLDLADFAQYMRDQGVDEEDAQAVEEVLGGSYLSVWVNHNQEFQDKWLEWNLAIDEGNRIRRKLKNEGLQKEPDGDRIAALTTELNKQTEITLVLGKEVEALLWGCEPDDVTAIYEVEAALARWINDRAWDYVTEYRSGRKKDAAP